MRRFVLALLSMMAGETSSAADFYAGVGTDNGPTGNDCSVATPCTLREAISQATISFLHNRVVVTTDVQLASALTVYGAQLDIVGVGSPAPKILGTGNTTSRVIAFYDGLILLENLDIESGAGGVAATGSAPGHMVLTLEDTILTMNIDQSADNSGGGLYASGADVRLYRVRFDSNFAQNGGGLFVQNGSVLIEDSTFHGNLSNFGGGLAIFDSATTIRRTTVDGNQSYDFAGGIGLSVTNHPIAVENVTIDANSVSHVMNQGAGGLLIIYSNTVFGQAHLTNLTIAANTASGSGTYGSALNVNSSDVHLDNSIVQGTCAVGSFPSATYVIESPGATCNFAAASAIQSSVSATDLALGALADNGGATQTMLPGAASFAVDAGASCSGEDQRGLVRDVGPCDIGAVEVGATLVNELFQGTFDP